MKRHLILGPRDISVFYTLHLHSALTLKQLADLCFPEVSFETARKRLRRLHQSGYMQTKSTMAKTDKGRPERFYFLNSKAAKALAENKNIIEHSISTIAPNIKHQEYLTHLAHLHMAWQRTAREENFFSYTFSTKRLLNPKIKNCKANENSDAIISFATKEGKAQTILLVLENGNLRPTRHWIPKMNSLLKNGFPILVVTTNRHRLDTLRKWTLPLLEEAGIPYERCMFMVLEEVLRYGYLAISAYSTAGSAMKISA